MSTASSHSLAWPSTLTSVSSFSLPSTSPSLSVLAMAARHNQWFVPGEGIAREVITADIQRYLGPDALVRPGSGTGEYEVRLPLR